MLAHRKSPPGRKLAGLAVRAVTQVACGITQSCDQESSAVAVNQFKPKQVRFRRVSVGPIGLLSIFDPHSLNVHKLADAEDSKLAPVA